VADFPRYAAMREAERRRIRSQVLAEAERRILRSGRSLKCCGFDSLARPRHAGDVDGCANSGATCICECHDAAGEVDG
jgi:hypothetical protein